jgi:hypothetical protein
MKDLVMALLGAVLAFVLSPGLLVRLPKNGSKVTVAACHAAVFGLLFFVLCHGMNTVAVQEGISKRAAYKDPPSKTGTQHVAAKEVENNQKNKDKKEKAESK